MSRPSKSSRPTRTRPGRYNPHAAATSVLELDPLDLDEPIVGQLDPDRDGDGIVPPPKPAGSAKRPANPKSQRVNATRSKNTRTNGSSRPARLPRKSKTHDLKATVAPLLATVGILLLVPAVWSTLLLVGVTVPGAEREDSRPMAAVMLLSWPIALCLIAASIAFFLQVTRYKRRLKKIF